MAYNQAFIFLFSLLAITATACLRKATLRHLALLLANIAFLGLVFYWRTRSLLLFLALLWTNFLLLKAEAAIPPGRTRTLLAHLLVSGNILALAYFNYPRLLIEAGLGRFVPVALVGLGWAALRLIHLAVDLGRGNLRERLGPLRYFNYLLFFPAYFSGPLARYDEFVTAFENPGPLSAESLYGAAVRVILGLFQLNVLAFALAPFSLHSLNDPMIDSLSPFKLVTTVVAFSLWIYFSFSGATDLAIGLSLPLGVKLPENFDRPFLAVNLQQFWQRWHMSLLAWARDYLYQPLLLSLSSPFPRFPAFATALALFISFALLGAWHGDALHFLLYGLYHGLGMVIYFAFIRRPRTWLRGVSSAPWHAFTLRAASWLLTWSFIGAGWFFYLGKEGLLLGILRRRLGFAP